MYTSYATKKDVFYIGDDVRVIVRKKGESIQILIDAPKSVNIEKVKETTDGNNNKN